MDFHIYSCTTPLGHIVTITHAHNYIFMKQISSQKFTKISLLKNYRLYNYVCAQLHILNVNYCVTITMPHGSMHHKNLFHTSQVSCFSSLMPGA